MEPLTLVIPTFNEAETIGGVIREIPVAYRLDIIVADVGSTDGTQAVAQAAGARVIDARHGYGRACALGAAAAHPKSTVIAFMDGDGADRRDLIGEIARPVLDGTYDLVLASRTRGERERGAMPWHQVFAGRVAGFGIGALYGVKYSDMCAFRAIVPRRPPTPGNAGNDLWLEYRNADEGGAGRLAYSGSATAVPVSRWGQFEGRGLVAWYAPSGQPHHGDFLPGSVLWTSSALLTLKIPAGCGDFPLMRRYHIDLRGLPPGPARRASPREMQPSSRWPAAIHRCRVLAAGPR